jgi:hypothetical protein
MKKPADFKNIKNLQANPHLFNSHLLESGFVSKNIDFNEDQKNCAISNEE